MVNQLVRLKDTQAKTYEEIDVVGDNIEVVDLIYKVFKYVLDDAYQGEVMLVQDDEKQYYLKTILHLRLIGITPS